MRTVRRRALSGALALALVTTLAAGCGDDDDDDEATTATTEAEGGGSGDLAASCAADIGVSQGFAAVFSQAPEFEGQPTPEQITQVQALVDEHLIPAIETIEKSPPAEIADDIERGSKLIRQFRDKPDPALFESEEFQALGSRIDTFFFENCENDENATVKAVDYEFQGLPDSMEAGPTRIRFENEGKEVHEMVVLTKLDGVTESWDALLELPQEEAMKKTRFVNATFAPAGDQGYWIADTEPGDYIAVCFIPQGTTTPETEVEGPPHFTLGMKTEFTVS